MSQEMREIAMRLQIARIIRGYRSRSAFVKQFNFKLGTYNSHEIGRHEIGASYINKYCAALNISVTWLLLGEGYPIAQIDVVREAHLLKQFECLTYLAKTGKPLFA
ncbi:MAG: hypothetical protein RL214_786 [Pseudomonadota bacterium]|jgi:hypothetical protein